MAEEFKETPEAKAYKAQVEAQQAQFAQATAKRAEMQRNTFAARAQTAIQQQLGSLLARNVELTTANEMLAKENEELKAQLKEQK
jgi:hypothetical protein